MRCQELKTIVKASKVTLQQYDTQQFLPNFFTHLLTAFFSIMSKAPTALIFGFGKNVGTEVAIHSLKRVTALQQYPVLLLPPQLPSVISTSKATSQPDIKPINLL